jgi:O-antigen/teichoic acid export membrane protein
MPPARSSGLSSGRAPGAAGGRAAACRALTRSLGTLLPFRFQPLLLEGANVQAQSPEANSAKTFTRNSALSVGRLFVSTAIALVLPSFLTHRLPVKTYSAWVLILQMSAYVGYLDFGIQTGIAKYVAEFEARHDAAGSSMRASAGLALMVVASILGVLLTVILAWRVPNIFHEMPSSLFADVRLSLLFVGISLSFGLLCSICSSIFLGLQQYAVPIVLSLVNRVLYTIVILVAVFLHQSLAVMGALVAAVNIVTGLMQFGAWRKLARHVHLRLRGLDFSIVRKMLSYCSTLAIWTAGMLCVSGLDVTIVGRYDYGQTAFYSIATLPTNFAMSIMGAALAPLLPTASALSVQRTPGQMGDILSRITRYGSILLIVSGIPLLVAGFWILRVWVGPVYALHALPYLRILVLANIIRNMCMPYASMLVATDTQRVAIGGAVAEAVVNLTFSIYLARHMGAIGVAYGTLIGSFVSVGVHFVWNMRYTRPQFDVAPLRLFASGIVRPALIAVPSLLLLRLWWSDAPPAFNLPLWIFWAVGTALVAWFATLKDDERHSLAGILATRLKLRTS